MSGLPADIFDRLSREYSVANAARILSTQHSYRTAPSAIDPVGGAVDLVAARTAGERLIAALEAESEVLASAPAMLASAVDAVAIMTDTTRDEAFQILAA